MCLPFLDPRFSNTTFNYGTYTLSDETRPLSMYPDINVPKLFGTMAEWWNTSRTGYGLINLTPHWDDRPQIPFLMMANANTKKLGCAFTVCNATDFSEYEFAQHLFPHLLKASHFVSFVCAYGPPNVKVGVPIYTEGPQCSACNTNCVYGCLCNNTATMEINAKNDNESKTIEYELRICHNVVERPPPWTTVGQETTGNYSGASAAFVRVMQVSNLVAQLILKFL
ncbi:hypothetical protein KIN20_010638 [Parelaphostrongylus tenuis]|uniref:SCP domain-containing protein n=1 Tax=Parelaphostrongylus tenuis TaxID=148309 RepID=A0AAD5MQV6_PARTN|nr:hypothetical protein KIN20_010638 [Parelaphostrongylus tenuis]